MSEGGIELSPSLPVSVPLPETHVARPPTLEDIEALRRHPFFADASAHAAAGLAAQYMGNRVLNRILSDRGRTVMGLAILDLHYNGDDEGGLTATRLKQRCTEFGVCSPGRVTAMLGALRLLGLIAEVRTPAGTQARTGDRRVRWLRPTEKFLAVHRERRRCFLEALAMLMPEGGIALEREHDSKFVAGHQGAFTGMFASGMRLTDYVPELETIFGRDAGTLIVLSLAVEARRAGRDPFAPLEVTLSELAKRFSVSRGHVLSVLRDAERQGLVVRVGARDGGIAVTASLLDTVDRFVAAVLLLHLAAIRRALATVGEGQRGRTGEDAPA